MDNPQSNNEETTVNTHGQRGQRFRCKLCHRFGSSHESIKIRCNRLDILHGWYQTLKSVNDRVHRSCLVVLGLEPSPDDPMRLMPLSLMSFEQIMESSTDTEQARIIVHTVCNSAHDADVAQLAEVALQRLKANSLFERLDSDYLCRFVTFKLILQCIHAGIRITPVDKNPEKRRRTVDEAPRTPHQNRNDSTPAVTVEPSKDDRWVCSRCAADNIRRKCLLTKPHSNVSAKRAHRDWILHYISQHPAKRPAILYLDDRLPNDDGEETYLTEELLKADDRIRPHQLFSPNLKPDVVEDLRALGVIHTEQICACQTDGSLTIKTV